MKKYIRTNTGRIYVSHDDLQIIDNTLCSMQNGRVWLVLGEVLKQSDDIYDLCDYVITRITFDELPDIHKLSEMDKKGELHNPPAKYIDNLKFLMMNKRVKYIKFANLTDKGLTFVAEMNQDGDIELL